MSPYPVTYVVARALDEYGQPYRVPLPEPRIGVPGRAGPLLGPGPSPASVRSTVTRNRSAA